MMADNLLTLQKIALHGRPAKGLFVQQDAKKCKPYMVCCLRQLRIGMRRTLTSFDASFTYIRCTGNGLLSEDFVVQINARRKRASIWIRRITIRKELSHITTVRGAGVRRQDMVLKSRPNRGWVGYVVGRVYLSKAITSWRMEQSGDLEKYFYCLCWAAQNSGTS